MGEFPSGPLVPLAKQPVSELGTRLRSEFFQRDAREVAQELIGKLLVRSDGRAARLVEVEAYLGLDDPGSHAFRGPTPRAAIMFGPPGRLYVYFSYGMHWCANVVCSPEGTATAVLLRAAQPVNGISAMEQARSHGQRELRERDLCRGPGRLTEAFGITGALNGLDLTAKRSELCLSDDGAGPGGLVEATLRVGLSASQAPDLPLRFVVRGSVWASPSPRPVVPVRLPTANGEATGPTGDAGGTAGPPTRRVRSPGEVIRRSEG
jgi:DNA-3-methyladenine glycosylase